MRKKYSTKNGFISIPRHLIINALKEINETMNESMMFICMLIHFNFSKSQECERGECAYTIRQWASIFRKSPSYVHRFFNRLIKEGELELISENPRVYRLTRYEELCGFRKQATGCGTRQGKRWVYDEDFLDFFETYNRLSGKKGADKHETYIAWQALTIDEKDMAIENCHKYINSIDNRLMLKTPYSYLRKKSFIL